MQISCLSQCFCCPGPPDPVSQNMLFFVSVPIVKEQSRMTSMSGHNSPTPVGTNAQISGNGAVLRYGQHFAFGWWEVQSSVCRRRIEEDWKFKQERKLKSQILPSDAYCAKTQTPKTEKKSKSTKLHFSVLLNFECEWLFEASYSLTCDKFLKQNQRFSIFETHLVVRLEVFNKEQCAFLRFVSVLFAFLVRGVCSYELFVFKLYMDICICTSRFWIGSEQCLGWS